jgi:biopolymer transport protein ExbB/TolQ
MSQRAPTTLLSVFGEATPVVQLVMLALVLLTAAAVAVCLAKLRPGAPLAGGSAFLSNLRWGGPMTGLLGAAYGVLNMLIGLANHDAVPMRVLAPGFAEVVVLIGLGLICGIVATIGNGAVEARIDRTVLRA